MMNKKIKVFTTQPHLPHPSPRPDRGSLLIISGHQSLWERDGIVLPGTLTDMGKAT